MHSYRVIDQYLARYAEPESDLSGCETLPQYDACFVLPIYYEPSTALDRFLHLPSDKPVLSVWVFNAPDTATEACREFTEQSLRHFLGRYPSQQLGTRVRLICLNEKHDLIIVDRCSPDALIPAKQGVGLARKIGADIALKALRVSNNLSSNLSKDTRPFIHFCDADVELPASYFSPQQPHCSTVSDADQRIVAMLYPFKHLPQSGLELACALYDFKLRYYTEQLARAASPYAYQALGSIIMLDPLAYAQVRGVPKRSGAEDFYLLNKLSKVGRIVNLQGPVLSVAGRHSERVPFGTGPAIDTISGLNNPLDEYEYYHPKSFELLKHLLTVVNSWSTEDYSSANFLQKLQAVCPCEIEALRHVLLTLKLEKFLQHCEQQNVPQDRFKNSFHNWFDAFLTLRFIHLMRDHNYPNVTIAHIESEGGMLSPQLLLAKEHIQDLTPK